MKSKINIKQLTIGLLIITCLGTVSWTAMNLLDGTNDYIRTTPTTIKFDQTEIDMGKLKQDQPQTATFAFQNTGTQPLVIQQVETTCGCTEPMWPKKPIGLGHTGEIKVTYDAKYPGRFVKSITVFCNSESGMEKLVVKGMVEGRQN